MKCDNNAGLINTKAVTEVPNDWIEIISVDPSLNNISLPLKRKKYEDLIAVKTLCRPEAQDFLHNYLQAWGEPKEWGKVRKTYLILFADP